jgi:alpha-tubulin suppressor-like RCC1 family protein
VSVTGITNAVAIAAGDRHSCAMLSDGTVQCWGDSSAFQLGRYLSSFPDSSAVPVAVSGITNAVGIAAGGDDSCVVLNDGTVQCWGDNSYSQLGNGSDSTLSGHVTVSGIINAISVSTGPSHTCAVLSGGLVQCWGANSVGELGDGSQYTSTSVPVTVEGITNALAVAASDASHTCVVVLSSGTIQCWGSNDAGALGNGTSTGSSAPVTVSGF